MQKPTNFSHMASVDRIASTIQSTIQKGNRMIRSQKTQNLATSKPQAQIRKKSFSQHELKNTAFTGDQPFNAYQLYQYVNLYARRNEKLNINIINLLNFAEYKWQQFKSIQHKTGSIYIEYLDKFKKIQTKMNEQLEKIIQNYRQSSDSNIIVDVNKVKIQVRRIIEYLTQKSRKFVDRNQQIVNLIHRRQKQDDDQQAYEESIKEEMLDMLEKLKGQAVNMGHDLKKDNTIISRIHEKQDDQIRVLNNKSASLQEILDSQRIGFFKLASMAGIGIVAWLFTLLFILLF